MKLPLKDIKPNPNNPRIIKDANFKKLVQSLRDFPEMADVREIVVNKDHVILGGNMRFKAMKEAGWTEAPVKVVDWPEDKQREFIIKDNVSGGEWDWDNLANDWDAELLDSWGLDLPGGFGDEEVEEDEAPEVDESEPPKSKLGEIYQLGRHRVMCGDSLKENDVECLMTSKAEVLFTSPPYSDMRDYNGEKDLSVDSLANFIPTYSQYTGYYVINLGLQFKDGEIIEYWRKYIDVAKQAGLKMLGWNVWDKTMGGSIASATNMFLLTHEWLFVFGRKPKRLKRTVPNQLDKYEARHGANWQEGIPDKSIRQASGEMTSTTSATYTHHQLHSVIQQTPELGPVRGEHPAIFPIALAANYIKAMTGKDDVVCDPFLGSGSTLIACEQTDRTCYGMELDPKYVDVIRKRYAKFTNNNELPDNWEELTTKITG